MKEAEKLSCWLSLSLLLFSSILVIPAEEALRAADQKALPASSRLKAVFWPFDEEA